MSSNPAAGVADTNIGYKEALSIIGIVCIVLIGLVAVKFGCHLFIDLWILWDPYEARQTVIAFRDRFLPCFKRRLVSPTERSSRDDEIVDIGDDDTGGDLELGCVPEFSIDRMVQGLTLGERKQVLQTILPASKVTRKDLNEWRNETDNTQHDPNHDEGISCPICLVDFDVDNSVFISPECNHVFHQTCITAWCKGNNIDCPYCRSRIVTKDQVASAISALPTP